MTEIDRIKNALVNVSLLARSDRYYSMLHGLVQIFKYIIYAIITITVRNAVRGSTGRNNNEQMERICRNY